MSEALRFVSVMALVVLAAFGWGDTLVRVSLGRPARRPGDEDLGVAMRVAVGLAAFLAVGGIAVAADVGGFAFLFGWQLVGLALAVAGRWHDHHLTVGVGRAVAFSLSGALVGLCALGVALTGPYNANDDGPAYLYLAQRLLATGGLIDPFNTRRVNSDGGAELFQAIVLRVAGDAVGLGIEWFLFAVLLVLLVARGARRRFAPAIVLVVGLGIVLVRPVGLWVNVAPTFSGAALTLALMQLMRGARRGRAEWRRFALGGLLLAAILSLRFEFFVAAALVLVATPLVIVRGRAGLQGLLGALGAFVVFIAGWAVALARSSGTPLFPLLPGNWTSADQWRDPAIHTLGGYLHRLVLGAEQDRWALAVWGALALALLVVGLARRGGALADEERLRLDNSLVVLVVAALGCLAELTSESVALSGALLSDVGRYSAPSALACLCFSLDLVIEAATVRWAPSALGARAERQPVGAALRRGWPGLAAAGGALVLFLAVLAVPLSFYAPAARRAAVDGVDLLSGRRALPDNFADGRREYRLISAKIPKGADVLAAVDEPELLDLGRYSFATLDVVGGSSPPPHLPLRGGPTAIIDYLRTLGYQGIVASLPRAPGLYNERGAKFFADSSIYNYRVSARAVLLWTKDLRGLTSMLGSSKEKVGTLVYLPFHRVVHPAPVLGAAVARKP